VGRTLRGESECRQQRIAEHPEKRQQSGCHKTAHEQGLGRGRSGGVHVAGAGAACDERRCRDRGDGEKSGEEGQTVGHEADGRQILRSLEQISGQPLVGEPHRDRQQLLHEDRQHEATDRQRQATAGV